MKFYDDTKPLYLETDASGVGLGAALLQLHDNTACQRDVAPDNASLRPITFASKSLTGAEGRYSNIKWRHWGYYTGWKNSIIIVLAERCWSSQIINQS